MADTTAANRRRLAGALTVGVAFAALAGCATVPGTGSADPSSVAAYQTTLASSRAAAAAAAGKAACTSWRAGYEPRVAATRATGAFTKDPQWNWDTIAPTINAEFAAIATETGKLPATVATATPNPSVHTLLTDYQAKLTAYSTALREDHAARGKESQTWPKSNPARRALADATLPLLSACPA